MAKRLGADYWQGHVDAWRRSGLTQVAYCAQHGLEVNAFYRWRYRVRVQAPVHTQPAPPLTLIPVNPIIPTTIGIHLHSPGGWRIELPVGGASWLADLLRHLP